MQKLYILMNQDDISPCRSISVEVEMYMGLLV